MKVVKFMKYIKLFEELTNVSKIRKWPVSNATGWEHNDVYFVYDLPKKDLGKYLNTWFVGEVNFSRQTKQ